MMATMLQQMLNGYYVQIPMTNEYASVVMFSSPSVRNTLHTTMASTPLLDFHHQDAAASYYGTPSPALCGILESLLPQADAQECYQAMDGLQRSSDHKGMVVLSQSNGKWTLSLSDKYIDLQGAVADHLLNHDLVIWTNDRIEYIHIPLSDDQDDGIWFHNDVLDIAYDDDEGKAHFESVKRGDRFTGV